MSRFVAFDIETTGLDPQTDYLRAISWATEDAAGVFYGAESKMLRDFNDFLAKEWAEELTTWNGFEFDLPFVAVRAAVREVGIGLSIYPLGGVGKYGNPLYGGSWHAAKATDVADKWKPWAEAHDVKWSLKPVAEALGLYPVTIGLDELTKGGEEFLARRSAYSLSDSIITWQLRAMEVPA